MSRKFLSRSAVVGLVCLIALAVRPACCRGQEIERHAVTAQAAPQVLVLQDGGVLTGTISLVNERYVLTRGGTAIEIPAAKVLIACNSLEEAYDARRKQIERPSAEAHLALAEWCLRYRLAPQAARELLAARGMEPKHPRLALLERRLATVTTPRPHRDHAVKQASHVDPLSTVDQAESLSGSVENLPEGAVEQFTRRVQPILVNNCTTSGCHQPGGLQSFQLDRALLHGLGNRRSTMRNLAATLAIVDRDQPHLSLLLTVPRRTHGGMRAPVFGPRQSAAFTHVVEWVALVSRSSSSEDQASPRDDIKNLRPDGP
jgi:hypothetical protein